MTRPRRKTLLAIVAFTLAACRPAAEQSDDTPAATSHDSLATAAWVVTPRGIGGVTAGMPIDRVNAALGRPLATGAGADTAACAFATIPDGPPGVSIMLEHGRVVRVDVDRDTTPTWEGVRIGDPEDRVLSVYAGRVDVSPQKYTTGHYLTVRATAPADSLFRIVFETDGRVVTRYRAGVLPAVAYVEKCG